MTVYTDADTVSTKTAVSGVDVLYRDASTISTKTTVTSVEDILKPSGYWGVADVDDGEIP